MSPHLQHRVVVKFPFVTSQDWSAINIDRSTALVHDEEIAIVFELDDPYSPHKTPSQNLDQQMIFKRP